MTHTASPTRSLSRTRARMAMVCGVATAAFVLGAAAMGWMQPAELRAFDAFARLARVNVAGESLVSAVFVTEGSIRTYGFPLPIGAMDALIDTLHAHGARTVGIDLFRDRVPASGALAQGVANGTVIVAYKLGDAFHRGVAPPVDLPGGAVLGFTDVVPDADDVVRRLLWLTDDSTGTQESLAFATARQFLTARGDSVGATAEGLPRLGTWAFTPFSGDDGGYRKADDAGFQYLMAWHRAPGDVPAVALDDVLEGRMPDAMARGRMIFVGADAPSLPDFVRLPVAVGAARPEGTPGVVVHAVGARELVSLASGQVRSLAVLPAGLEWLLVIAGASAGALLAWRQRSVAASLAILAATMVGMGIATALSLRAGLWVPVAVPVSAFAGSAAVTGATLGAHERRARAAIGRLFARHLSPQLAQEVWERRDELRDGNRLKPQRLQATILFADLRGFSGRAEQLDPTQLLDWISEFTDAMSQSIMAHGGLIDDFAGDGIKADFGVPIARPGPDAARTHAVQAVRAALAMEAELGRLNASWLAQGRTPTAMRIGIASGSVVAGNVGSADRLKYTVVGDVVNIAARLEAFDGIPADFRVRPCRILVDGATAALVGDTLPLQSLGEHRVKGREQPVVIHAVEAIQPEVSHATS